MRMNLSFRLVLSKLALNLWMTPFQCHVFNKITGKQLRNTVNPQQYDVANDMSILYIYKTLVKHASTK